MIQWLLARRTPLLLWLLDLSGLWLCVQWAMVLHLGLQFGTTTPAFSLFAGIALLCLYLFDNYYPVQSGVRRRQFYWHLLAALGAAAICFSLLVYLAGLWGRGPLFGRGVSLLALLLFSGWAFGWRWILEGLQRRRYRGAFWLLLAEKPVAEELHQEQHRYGYSIPLIHYEASQLTDQLEQGQAETWQTEATQENCLGVIVESHLLQRSTLRQALLKLRLVGVLVVSVGRFTERYWQEIPPALPSQEWLILSDGFGIFRRDWQRKLKRLGDMLVAAGLLLLTSPVLLLTALAIQLEGPGGIFFSQIRHGEGMRKIRIWKFRSMTPDAEASGAQWAQQEDPRITRVGSVLRKTRIDELPQLWNVLKGDLSLIGPRPERPEFDQELQTVIPYYTLRYSVQPGLSGWAQVMFPYGASVEDAYRKTAYDLFYVKNLSLGLDLLIFLRTLKVILGAKGR
jgi:exopolysaccharide biosynthesis polyprenyl glycosylphosphotransferase